MNSHGGSQRGGGTPPHNFGGGKSNYNKHYTGMIPESEEIGRNSDEHSNPSEGSGGTKGKGKAAYDSAYRKKQHEPNQEAQAAIKDVVQRSLQRHLRQYLGDIVVPVSYHTDPNANMGSKSSGRNRYVWVWDVHCDVAMNSGHLVLFNDTILNKNKMQTPSRWTPSNTMKLSELIDNNILIPRLVSHVMEGITSGLLPTNSPKTSAEQNPVEHAPEPFNPPQYNLEQELLYLQSQLELQPAPPEQQYGLAGYGSSQTFSNVTNRNYKK
ncbi:hypothetical protein AOL_s00193g181 [Orbilia oligospora ATCC 24927]|uniref:Uncharacterized protein n=1 Tax=Arthrobotrys oligospora (strain ATCC 24927 / CBS 115.81 / DSM 1491) TaxID=756982 RepID=G1XRI2_ARTOA|nr:hypothetical protein AOL_s00193g181 [Orbilia oligospora ATCC 24927]EGX44269.1 hypothetical protein AOL_s00193g181 [Orbilia oligospora ATCC 24927]